MTWSEAKKKSEASATITNTMMVVMVVSRRVGQVTLAVSERTSCRNLNGLKAILDVIRVARRVLRNFTNPNSPLAPSPLQKDEPASGLDCSGDFKAAPGIRQTGRQQVPGMYCGVGKRSRRAGYRSFAIHSKARNGRSSNQGLGRHGHRWSRYCRTILIGGRPA